VGARVDSESADFDFAEQLLQRAVGTLATEFEGVFSPGTIERYVRETQILLDALPISRQLAFHRARVDWFARERLEALAQAERRVDKLQPEALFVCVHNAGRSQMAAALTHHLSEGWVHVRSAGSQPGFEIEPNVVAAMAELGVDVTHEFPKPLTDEVVRAADVVITMGCGDSCPVYPGKHYEDWEVADPHDQPLEVVSAIRDDIAERVRALLEMFSPAMTAGSPDVA
jgi:arsenate reductase (thioredoxin)